MAFPIIPILAALGVAVGIGTLAWYSDLSQQKRVEADQKALQWFGRRFKDLAKAQQEQIRQRMS
jgi:hypothetical protein